MSTAEYKPYYIGSDHSESDSNQRISSQSVVVVGGIVVTVPSTGSKVRGFKPGRGHDI
jgi:hypothetical protein